LRSEFAEFAPLEAVADDQEVEAPWMLLESNRNEANRVWVFFSWASRPT